MDVDVRLDRRLAYAPRKTFDKFAVTSPTLSAFTAIGSISIEEARYSQRNDTLAPFDHCLP